MVERLLSIIRQHLALLIALLLAILLKVSVLAIDSVPFNADEAVVALMARHILQGARPVFFYGQSYLGSTDAWLIAAGFTLVGQQVFAIRVVQTLLYVGTLIITYRLALKILDRWAAGVAALLLALPPVLMTLYTTATLGGYGETLLIGAGLWWWTVRLQEAKRNPIEWLLFGWLAGFGFWTFGLLGVYLVPIGFALLLSRINSNPWTFRGRWVDYGLALLGFVFGSSPWWLATLAGAATVSELGGSAIAGANSNFFSDLALRVFSLLVLGISVIIGLRPPWGVGWLALPLAPLALVIFFASLGWAIKAGRTRPPLYWLLGLIVTLCAVFILTPFGNDPSGRYFLPVLPPLAIFAAGLLNQIRAKYPRIALGVVGALLAFNLWGNLESALTFPPGLTTQFDSVTQVNQRDLPRVITFLKAQGETRGYSNYWVTFPLAFLSHEELLYSAELPYHPDFRYTPRDNRYAPYIAAVAASERVAYITTRHPALDQRLRVGFATLGVTYQEEVIGDFHIFYNLARKVTPVELAVYEVVR